MAGDPAFEWDERWPQFIEEFGAIDDDDRRGALAEMLERRDEQLEDWLTGSSVPRIDTGQPGYLSDVESRRFYFRRAHTITYWRVSNATKGSTSTVVSLRVDGTEEDTLTLTSSDFEVSDTVSIEVPADSYVTFKVTTIGTGVADLGIEVW